MNIKIGRQSITLELGTDLEVAYIEEVLGLKKDGDYVYLVRKNEHLGAPCSLEPLRLETITSFTDKATWKERSWNTKREPVLYINEDGFVFMKVSTGGFLCLSQHGGVSCPMFREIYHQDASFLRKIVPYVNSTDSFDKAFIIKVDPDDPFLFIGPDSLVYIQIRNGNNFVCLGTNEHDGRLVPSSGYICPTDYHYFNCKENSYYLTAEPSAQWK